MKNIYIDKNIKYLRKSRGLTSHDLSEYFEVSRSAISHVETGKNRPSFDFFIGLANFFSVSLDDLVYRNMQETPPSQTNPGKGLTPVEEETLMRLVIKLQREINELTKEISDLNDPNDVSALQKLRQDLIEEYPDRARELGLLK